MRTLMQFDPLFRRTIGFDRFTDLIDSLVQTDRNVAGYPPYNIEKSDTDKYRIVMAVAGFNESELNITAQDNTLLIDGRTSEQTQDATTYLHKGIAGRSFQRSFQLADYVVVKDAELKNGLLVINLVRELPDAAKPRMIPISAAETVVKGEQKKIEASH